MSNTDSQAIEDRGGPRLLHDVRSFYRSGEEIVIAALPAGTSRGTASRASGRAVVARLDEAASFEELAGATYCIEAFDDAGALLGEELTTVGAHQGERPVHGFATSFG